MTPRVKRSHWRRLFRRHMLKNASPLPTNSTVRPHVGPVHVQVASTTWSESQLIKSTDSIGSRDTDELETANNHEPPVVFQENREAPVRTQREFTVARHRAHLP